MGSLTNIFDAIELATGSRPTGNPETIGGGCINKTFRLDDLFVKTNTSAPIDMFAAEADGLEELGKAIRTPEVIAHSQHFLILEYLDLSTTPQAELGRQLATLHQTTHATFGWHRSNYIGATPQENLPTESWPAFFRDHRLRPLLAKLPPLQHSEDLLNHVDTLISHDPKPALLHGDLWGGNAAGLPDGTPVIFDPATYYGDPEIDLAMTRLFGGFTSDFYAAYHELSPPINGHQERTTLYNLYHILNHALLFGGSYHRQAQEMIRELV